MPNTADSIRAAANPQAALIVLAEALDRIEELLAHPPVAVPPAWGEWETVAYGVEHNGGVADVVRPVEAAPERDEALIAALRERLTTETDGEERRALEAQLRLADEGGLIVAEDRGPLAGVINQVAEDEVLIELPPADPERQQRRRQWAQQVRLGTLFDPAMDEELAVESYVKGGPLWLYHGNDELARSFPIHMKQMFVNDIEHDSPRTAQEIARDLLKADLDDARGDAPTGLDALAGELA